MTQHAARFLSGERHHGVLDRSETFAARSMQGKPTLQSFYSKKTDGRQWQQTPPTCLNLPEWNHLSIHPSSIFPCRIAPPPLFYGRFMGSAHLVFFVPCVSGNVGRTSTLRSGCSLNMCVLFTQNQHLLFVLFCLSYKLFPLASV